MEKVKNDKRTLCCQIIELYGLERVDIKKWHIRALCGRIKLFDYFPKARKLFDLRRQVWHELPPGNNDVWQAKFECVIENILEHEKIIPSSMRFALRNQMKIESALGKNQLDRILESLKNTFSKYENIENEVETIKGEPYPVLFIEDCHAFGKMISFYVLGKKYDILKLAFKEFLG